MAHPRRPRNERSLPARPRKSATHVVTPQPPLGTPAALPPLFLDPWAWASLGVLVFVLARAWGVPFGEPVADDFDHLHHALFARDHSWWGGGGSASFWRPLAYQGYYGAFTGLILSQPGWVTVLHTTLAAVAVLAVYDTLRRRVAPPLAALAAAFPWLLESSRALLAVPVHIVDLGMIVLSALAWRAAATGRLVLSLIALAGALLCKETAVATAIVLPWFVPPGRPRRAWFVGAAAVTLVWAAAYLAVRAQLALALPHGLEARLGPGLLLDPSRFAWALSGTWRALVSLPLKGSPADGAVLAALLAILGGALVVFATNRPARARLSAVRGLVSPAWAWGALTTLALVTVYPVWSPERVVFAALGLGTALLVSLDAARRAFAVALVALQIVMFALAPAPPERVSRAVPDRGAFVDFERLARLQRLMLEARTTLRHEFPHLRPGARVAMLHPPFMADYAAGDRALQTWYRDSTLRWVRWEEMAADEARSLDAAMEFQEHATPPFRRVEPRALRTLFAARELVRAERFAEAAETLRVAGEQLSDTGAHHVRGRIWGLRAWCLAGSGRVREGDSLAHASLAIAPENADGHLTLAAFHNGRGEWQQSLAHLDTLESWYPGYAVAVAMRKAIMERMAATPAPPR